MKQTPYDLRHAYGIHLQLGLVLTLLAFIGLFKSNLDFGGNLAYDVPPQEMIQMEEIVRTEQVVKPPPPPRPPVPVEVPNDEMIEDTDLNLDAELDLSTPLELPPPPPPGKPADQEAEEPEVFIFVEEEPELIGGIEGLMKRIEYPEMARRANIQGRVHLQFVVDEQGNVVNPVVTRGLDPGCDEAALKAIRTAKFKPGKQRGKPVKVQYAMFVTFRLRN